jgi:hypothetical protein
MSTVKLESLGYRIDTDFRRSLLQSIALFRGIEADNIGDLLPQCGRIDIAEGDVLLAPQRANRCVYVILSGRLTVHLGCSMHRNSRTSGPARAWEKCP